jgi:membrane-bound inhibitor of C-type lysozyme
MLLTRLRGILLAMSTKTTISLLAILFVVIGLLAYYKGVQKGVAKATGGAAALVGGVVVPTASSTGAAGNQPPAWIPSASFGCKDNTHFIAQFPNENTLGIIVDGKLVRAVPHVSGDGQRYEDATYVYVFAGEEATVTNKAAKKTTTCEQPMDPNNAPMNFGDAAEGGAGFATVSGATSAGANGSASSTKPDTATLVAHSIIGTWKSTEDEKFVRVFGIDGMATDFYDGKAVTAGGKWQVFTGEKPLKVSFPVEKNAIYIQMTVSGSQSDTLNFKLGKLTPEDLDLIYVDRGNTNSFTRVK